MSNIVRASKFRHVFGQLQKDAFTAIKATSDSSDCSFSSVNPKFVAIINNLGRIIVIPHEKVGRQPTDIPIIDGHAGMVYELEWNPFNDNMLASASEDCSVKIWEIPDGGLKQTLTEPLRVLEGHQKKVQIIEWHPSAEYILASGGADNKIIIWDVLEEKSIYTLLHPALPTFMSWNFDGSLLATTCKDGKIRIWDPRKENTVQESNEAFKGNKHSKCKFLKNGMIFVAGFTKSSERKCGVWDSNDLSKDLVEVDIDSASGSMQVYDAENNVIFICAKGEQSIRFFEVTDEAPYLHALGFSSPSTSGLRCAAFMPRRGLDVTKCEIARCYKVGKENAKYDKCEVISMVVPRKSTLFQDDIYTLCDSGEPSLTNVQWRDGKNADRKQFDMRILYDNAKSGKGAPTSTSSAKPMPGRTMKAMPTVSAAPAQNGAIPPNVDLVKLVDDVKKLKGTMRKVCNRLTALEKQLGEVVADDLNEEEE